MKASELRIGYKVITSRSKKMHDVVRLGFMTINNNAEFRYEPVPITKNILLEYGFEPLVFLEINTIHWSYGELTIFQNIETGRITFDMLITTNGISIDYLHQLQNLYLAFFGKELIKNK